MNGSVRVPQPRDPAPARRVIALGWAMALALVMAVAGLAATDLARSRDEALANADRELERTVSAAEAEVNRALMSVDLKLAGLPAVLAAAQIPGGFLAEAAHTALAQLQERQLLFTDLALIDESGQTLTTALRATRRRGPTLPPGLLARIRGAAVPGLHLEGPVVGSASGERALLIGRPLDLPGAPPLVALAEVPAGLPLAATAAAGARSPGLEVSIERGDGSVLAREPPDDRAPGPRSTAPRPELADGVARRETGQDGRPWRAALRSTLYPGIYVAVRRPEAAALAAWEAGRWRVLGVAGVFSLLLLGVGALAHAQIRRLATARQAAAASQALLDQALDSMGDAFLLCDADDRVVRWNRRYTELFPWLQPVLAPGVSVRTLAEVAAAARGSSTGEGRDGKWLDERLRQRRRAGHQLEFQETLHTGVVISCVERRMPDGGIVSVYHDMSATEQRLARARADAEAANLAKSQFLATMSHEIRTPLNAVLGLNELLLLSRLDDEQRRHAELVRSSGQLLMSLINDVLDLSRIEAGHFEAREEVFEPGRVAGEVVALLDERAVALRLALTLEDRTPPGVRLLSDPVRIRQVLFNLIGNALKFTERGGVTVRLALAGAGDDEAQAELTLEVEDTGVGIPPELMPRLFQRFSQADSGLTRRHGGSGLGLAITREVVERLGGRIAVSSGEGRGSRFTVTLPCRRADAPLPFSPETRPGLPGLAADEPLQVLVAEDNAVNQILIEALLRHLGHRPTLVANGLEAVEAVRAMNRPEGGSPHFDAVLMDMQMPELDGLEATRRIRALPGAAGRVPVVAMTANALASDRQACFEAGMDGFVGKPIEIERLAEALRDAQALRPARGWAARPGGVSAGRSE